MECVTASLTCSRCISWIGKRLAWNNKNSDDQQPDTFFSHSTAIYIKLLSMFKFSSKDKVQDSAVSSDNGTRPEFIPTLASVRAFRLVKSESGACLKHPKQKAWLAVTHRLRKNNHVTPPSVQFRYCCFHRGEKQIKEIMKIILCHANNLLLNKWNNKQNVVFYFIQILNCN